MDKKTRKAKKLFNKFNKISPLNCQKLSDRQLNTYLNALDILIDKNIIELCNVCKSTGDIEIFGEEMTCKNCNGNGYLRVGK